jgi:hypothetical protein
LSASHDLLRRVVVQFIAKAGGSGWRSLENDGYKCKTSLRRNAADRRKLSRPSQQGMEEVRARARHQRCPGQPGGDFGRTTQDLTTRSRSRAVLLMAPPPHGARSAPLTRMQSRGALRLRRVSRVAFAAGRGGLLQLLDVSGSPCCRSHPAGVVPPRQPDCDGPCCLRTLGTRSASGIPCFRGYPCVHSRYGPVTRSPSS